jgi:cell division protein FtsZ
VLNEALGDEVKVTVIATGFERAGLPTIIRRPRTTEAPAFEIRSSVTSAPVAHPEPVRSDYPLVEAAAEEPAPVELAPAEVEPEPQGHHQPKHEEPQLAAAAHANGTAEPLFDDLDVPAILKRDRRFVQ